MTRQEAVHLYINNSQKRKHIIYVLEKWDHTKTISENAQLICIPVANAIDLSKRYKLPCRRLRKNYVIGGPKNGRKI